MKYSNLVLVAAIWVSPVYARCQWLCVDGKLEALCERAIDLEPPAPAIWCRPPPRSIAPRLDNMPPLGSTECRMAQVLNPYTDQYVWKRLCR